MVKTRNQGYVGFDACGGGVGIFGVNDFYNRKAFPIPNVDLVQQKRLDVIEPKSGLMQGTLAFTSIRRVPKNT